MIIGYIVQKKYSLDLTTLARINIYYVVPAFIFVRLYTTEIAFHLFMQIVIFFGIFILLFYFISELVGKLMRYDKSKRVTFTNSVMFFNAGNYGIPVNDLVFRGDPFAMSIQVISLLMQNVLLYSYGVFSLQSAKIGKLRAILAYFRMPVFYALVAGLLLGAYEVPIPQFIWVPANYIADSMIALALFTLGAQVAQLKLTKGLGTVYLSMGLRLVAGPIVALAMILISGLEGVMAQALLIASAMPTAVNSAVIAEEYKAHPEMAAQIVMFSTLFSAITVSAVIYVARLMF